MKAAISFPFFVASPKDRFASALKDVLNKLVTQHNTDVTIGPALASAATLRVTAKYHHVTGTAAIKNIIPPAGFKGDLHLIPDGLWTLVTGGNIGLASAPAVGKVVTLIYDGSKFYPSY